jgi:hypothetical protein
VLAVLLLIAGAGYLIDNVGKMLVPGYDVTISTFTVVGEGVFLVWLRIQGGKAKGPIPANP